MQFLIDVGLSILYFTIFLLLCAWAWRFWIMYVQQKHLNSIDWLLLEIKLPREILKSPIATETALLALLQSGGVGNIYARWFQGKLPAYASLEIASLEGVIHFYVRVQRRFRSLVEANFYAQYPDVEIVEADDYTSRIRYHHLTKDAKLFGAHYKPTRKFAPDDPKTGKPYPGENGKDYEMPADFLPIKTYVDYGLDKDPKEEFKIDPITPLLEAMGDIGKGEYFWYQILVQDESVYNGSKAPKFYVNAKTHEHFSLSDLAALRKKQIRKSHVITRGEVVLDEYGNKKTKSVKVSDAEEGKPAKYEEVDVTYGFPENSKDNVRLVNKKEIELTLEEKDQIEAINKKLSKPLAVCVIRAIYVTRTENFKNGQINNILSILKPFNGINGLGPDTTEPYEYPWQNLFGRRIPWRAEEKFEEYVEREGFFPHIKGREDLDKFEDNFFWSSTMKQRKLFRMLFESIVYPFDHPHADQAFTLNVEELATLWHLPGAVAGTPTLPRIDTAKGMAPVNLPL